MLRAQLVIIREAIEVVLRHVASLAPSDRTTLLQARLQDCAQEAEMWSAASPTRPEIDALMTRLLALHVEVRTLERQAPLAEGEAVTG